MEKINEKNSENKNFKSTKFLNEKDFDEICYQIQKQKLSCVIAKENKILNLPYSEDRVNSTYSEKKNSYGNILINEMESCLYFGIGFSYMFSSFRYYGGFNMYRFILNIPIYAILIAFIRLPGTLRCPQFQEQNTKDFSLMTGTEVVTKTLQEKTDLYDSIDAILELRQRYSLYELNQLKKENKTRNNDIVAENMEYFYKFTNNKI
jgi:hypothetical protein